jgi:hypothetical protein
MLSGRLLLRSAITEVTHEYRFSTGGELMHRFVDYTENPSKSAGSFTPAPEHLVRELIRHYPAQLESLCREAGVDFEKFSMRFQAAG